MNVEASSTWKFSLLSIGTTLLITISVAQWHSSHLSHHPSSRTTSSTDRSKGWSPPFPAAASAPTAPKIDDDITRDEICRRYLYNFLNGTTDAQDECDGMYHAFEAADCSGDELLQQEQQRQQQQQQHSRGFSYDSHNNNGQPFDGEFLRSVAHPHKHDDGNITDDNVVMDDYYQKWTCCTSIYHYYTRHCHQPKLVSTKLLGLVLIMVVCSGIKGLLRTFGWDWIPDSAACIVVGAIAGGSLRMISTTGKNLCCESSVYCHAPNVPPFAFLQ
jgi:hypothetical protein